MSEGSSCSDHWPRPTFGVVREGGGRFNLLKLAPMLEDIHERLAGVVIECLPWRAFIERYDRPGMLFYLDPPYWGSEKDYGPDAFGREQFAEMVEVLKGLQGAFTVRNETSKGL
jgi:DNA adenine methylase